MSQDHTKRSFVTLKNFRVPSPSFDLTEFYVQHNGSAMNSRKKVLFLFPYIAFEEMYNKICSIETVNSRTFFDIGVLKFLAQFEFVIYRQAERTEKKI